MKTEKIKETLEEKGYSVISACNQIVGIGDDGNGYYLGEIVAKRIFPSQGKVSLARVNKKNYQTIRELEKNLFADNIPRG
jgi:hypothetical protein